MVKTKVKLILLVDKSSNVIQDPSKVDPNVKDKILDLVEGKLIISGSKGVFENTDEVHFVRGKLTTKKLADLIKKNDFKQITVFTINNPDRTLKPFIDNLTLIRLKCDTDQRPLVWGKADLVLDGISIHKQMKIVNYTIKKP